ncbi:MAG: bacillithiol system redox-active protein YtxJ [Candidatus Hydrogenedentota bacterium]
MKELKTKQDWETCLEASGKKPVFVFKHSTDCPISSAAHERVSEYDHKTNGEKPAIYIVKVIENRPVSNQIAKDLGVQHRSPQIILVKDKAPVWSASHHSIRGERMQKAFEKTVS